MDHTRPLGHLGLFRVLQILLEHRTLCGTARIFLTLSSAVERGGNPAEVHFCMGVKAVRDDMSGPGPGPLMCGP